MERFNIGLIPRLKQLIHDLPLPQKFKQYSTHPSGPLSIHYWWPLALWPVIVINFKEIKKPGSHTSLTQQLGLLSTCVTIFVYRYSWIPQMLHTRMDLMLVGTTVLAFTSLLRIIKVAGEQSAPTTDVKVDKKILRRERSNKRLPVKKKPSTTSQ